MRKKAAHTTQSLAPARAKTAHTLESHAETRNTAARTPESPAPTRETAARARGTGGSTLETSRLLFRRGGCGYLGPRPTTKHAAAARSRKARERGFRVDFRPRVFVSANDHRRFVPRDRCRGEPADSRRASARAANARALSRHAELEAERPTYPRPRIAIANTRTRTPRRNQIPSYRLDCH